MGGISSAAQRQKRDADTKLTRSRLTSENVAVQEMIDDDLAGLRASGRIVETPVKCRLAPRRPRPASRACSNGRERARRWRPQPPVDPPAHSGLGRGPLPPDVPAAGRKGRALSASREKRRAGTERRHFASGDACAEGPGWQRGCAAIRFRMRDCAPSVPSTRARPHPPSEGFMPETRPGSRRTRAGPQARPLPGRPATTGSKTAARGRSGSIPR